MLEDKWPERYNSLGHVDWRGRLYGSGFYRTLLFRRWRVYYGVWGSGLFQSLYEAAPGTFSAMLMMPESYLIVTGLIVLSLMGLLWSPLLLAAPPALLSVCVLLGQAVVSGRRSFFPNEPLPTRRLLKRYAMTALLYLLQSLARLSGRLRQGLTPWRRRGKSAFTLPRPQVHIVWSESWQALGQRLRAIETALREQGAVARRGGDYDRWDLEVRGGLFGTLRVRATVEEHGGGNQLVRLRSWPRFALPALLLTLLSGLLAFLSAVDKVWSVASVLALLATWLAGSTFASCASAQAWYQEALGRSRAGGGQFVEQREHPQAQRAVRRPKETQVASAGASHVKTGSQV
jgi:hypothetical protein